MESKRFVVHNQNRQTTLSSSVASVNAALEPLKVLKVLIEGLPASARTGLWLTNFKGVPVARTLSPFDLVYLDKDNRVLHGVELSKDGEFAPFRGRPASALVLPSHSLKSSQTREGDQLELNPVAEEAESVESTAAPASAPTTDAPPAVSIPAPHAAHEQSPSAHFFSSLAPPATPGPIETRPPFHESANPAEQFSTDFATQRESSLAQAPDTPPATPPSFEPGTGHDFFTPA